MTTASPQPRGGRLVVSAGDVFGNAIHVPIDVSPDETPGSLCQRTVDAVNAAPFGAHTARIAK